MEWEEGGKSSQWGGSEVLLGGGDVLPGEENLRWSDLTIRAFLKAKHHSENIEHILKSKLPTMTSVSKEYKIKTKIKQEQ